jgi:hypothetical protein
MNLNDTARCDACDKTFPYRLIHSGFNDSAYAYCDRCGMTALLSRYGPVPSGVPVRWHGSITIETEPYLQPCGCGGRFN